MQTIARCWVLLIWVQTLTHVNCQPCHLAQFKNSKDYDSNFDLSGLEETYEGGRQVRVPCNIGYTGFFKLICTEGNWKPIGKPCQAKSCGHPGEAQFADFELEEGDDFVFGSQVIYICQKGYHMVSRSNRRRCMAEGWDGVVPVCEAIKCPTIHIANNVQVIGDPDEATFGNAVRFSCKSSSEVLDGPSEIYCNDRGEWSGSVPICKELKCDIPEIEHGRVPGGTRQYSEHETLNFVCDHGYTPTNNMKPKCTKSAGRADWIPTPACQMITCQLDLPPPTGTTYPTRNKNLFLAGEKVQVQCGEKYYILNHKTTRAEVTCDAKGKWNTNPVCLEVVCEHYIRGEGLYDVDAWRRNRLDDTVWFYCKNNYEASNHASYAKCTRDGWTPNPLCQALYCRKPNIENGRITSQDNDWYYKGDKVQYRCLTGNQKSFTATCQRGTWTGATSCSHTVHCTKPEILHGFAVAPLNDDVIYYSCDEGYKLHGKSWWGEARCVDGVWSNIPECAENNPCGEAPVVPNGKVRPKTTPGSDEIFEIVCDGGDSPETNSLTCLNGVWNLDGLSLEKICQPTAEHCSPPPRVENAIILEPFKKQYLPDSSVTYQCREKYMIVGQNTIACKAGRWEEKNITCTSYCEKLENSRLVIEMSAVKEKYTDEESINYVCKVSNDEGTATCVNGKWETSVDCPGLPCEVGEMTRGLGISGNTPANNQVNAGHKLRFFCSDEYDLEGSSEIECLETGQWNAPFPKCTEKCRVPDLPNNIIASPAGSILISKGETLTFRCRSNRLFLHGKTDIECLGNGEWSNEPPTCQKDRPGCGKPPALTDGDYLGIAETNYNHGDRVQYDCQDRYTLEGTQYKTCDNGVWTGDMRCLKPCTVDTERMDRNNIQFAYGDKNKLYAPHKDHLTFVCKRGTRKTSSGSMQKQCLDGVMELPTCQ